MNPYGHYLTFVVDPQRDGVANALWKFVVGTPSVTGNKFRFNTAEGLVRADVYQGRFEFSVTIPLTGVQTPTNLVNDIEFGLKNLSFGNIGKIQIIAKQSTNKFTLNTYDMFGTVQTTDITYRTGWNGVVVRFAILWFQDRVRLMVIEPSGTVEQVLAEHKVNVSDMPLNPYVKATGNDNFDVDFILVDKSRTSSIMLI